MPGTQETPQHRPADLQRTAKNRESDTELLRLIRAYREKGHARDGQTPSPEQDEFITKLYALIDRTAGVTFVRDSDGVVQREMVGWLARECGLNDRAEEFATAMKTRLENNAQRDGGYLAKWSENGGASIATYVTNMGRDEIARDLGRKPVEDAIRLAEPFQGGRDVDAGEGGMAEATEHEDIAEMGVREKTDRAIAERKRTGQELLSVGFDSLSNFESDNEYGSDERLPIHLPPGLRTSESPLASFLRVSSLVTRLQSLGNEMKVPAASAVVNGKTRMLTANHCRIWLAYLGLSAEQHQNLDVSMSTLCKNNGWSVTKAKAMLADCFAFLQAHKRFDEICDLMVPSDMGKRMDTKQLDERRNDVRKLLNGEDAEQHGRATFRKLIQLWIAKYSGT